MLQLTAVVALLSGLLWFVFSAANMSGYLSDLTDPEVLWTVARDTSFGVVWTARMLLAVTIVVVTTARSSPSMMLGRNLIIAILAAGLLASLAGVGHTPVEEGWASVVHMLSDAAHLLAAGAWIGGLLPLAFILIGHARADRQVGSVDRVLLRFSGMGYAAVATLVGTGLVNSWFLVGSISNLLPALYGRILFAKLIFFFGMLGLAVANRFWLVPSISEVRSAPQENGSTAWLHRLRAHVLGGQLLGATILLIVSVLGIMQPAIGQ